MTEDKGRPVMMKPGYLKEINSIILDRIVTERMKNRSRKPLHLKKLCASQRLFCGVTVLFLIVFITPANAAINHKVSTGPSTFLLLLVFILIMGIISTISAVIQSRKPRLYDISSELSRIDNMNGVSFENWCAELFKRLGFTQIQTTKSSGDFGADIICNIDGKRTVVQCKRYNKHVGIKPVQEILGARIHYNASVMIVITNNFFTASAVRLARESVVNLWDRSELQRRMNNVNAAYAEKMKKKTDQKKTSANHEERRTVSSASKSSFSVRGDSTAEEEGKSFSSGADKESSEKKETTGNREMKKGISSGNGRVPTSQKSLNNSKQADEKIFDKTGKQLANQSVPKKKEETPEHSYEITVLRNWDKTEYVLYRDAVSESRALASVYRVIDVNEKVIQVRDLGVFRH